MSEYPKSCTMEEAVACVKAGGKAEFCGTGDPTIIKIRKTKSGKVFHGFTRSTNRRYSDDFCRGWIYQITKPAPVTDQSTARTYTTAEAVAEVLRSGEEMVGRRNTDTFTLKLDADGDIVCENSIGPFAFIPSSNVTWIQKYIAPKTVTKSLDFDLDEDGFYAIGTSIMDATRGLGLRPEITIEFTIKER